VANLADCLAWLQRCIERLEELCRAKRPRLAVGHRQCLVARIARLAGAKTQLERRFVHVGGENASEDNRSLVWREIDAAFESRVLTGAKNLSRLVRSQITGNKNKKFFCDRTKEKNEKNFNKNCVKLRFIDSYKFLSASLDKLASYLKKEKLKIVRSEFSTLSNEEFELLTRKGVFPYEYVDCVEKLDDTRLPPRESFYSSLTGDTVSESDYAHAANVWQRFSVRTLGEYSDLYLKTDILLLADIFENFREMIERGIHGGLSQCSDRYAQANNKYMRSYDPSKPSSYLMYYDVNNLYGWAMCQPLPYADFQWVEDAANFDVSAIASDSPTGYILKVDLEYPQHLHDRHMYRDKCKIMYTDTDSLIYHIECEDLYETMKRDIVRFDTSDYPANNAYGMPLANKKVPGLMKDENNGTIMTEFVELRVKMYALPVDGKDTKAKGVKSNVVARTITFVDYTRCLNEEIEMTRRQSCIRSKLHEVYTISESKIVLNPYDNKRYVVPDSTETLPWGHWRIPL
ncbi:hypothetical protein ALC60_12862, partial [Trachymyrmex zeteki]